MKTKGIRKIDCSLNEKPIPQKENAKVCFSFKKHIKLITQNKEKIASHCPHTDEFNNFTG
jgi:hypothetical protein